MSSSQAVLGVCAGAWGEAFEASSSCLGFTGPLPALEPMEKVGGQCRRLVLVCCGVDSSR